MKLGGKTVRKNELEWKFCMIYDLGQNGCSGNGNFLDKMENLALV